MSQSIESHCAEIDRCNQRGGRMLSIVDLIDARTMTEDIAAYALAGIFHHGASFMVGARPGGAGKTTVMGALLNFVPADVHLAPADNMHTMEEALRGVDNQRYCYICHEIGAGPYYAYLWDDELRKYFSLPAAGHMTATNLHADLFEEAYQQVCTTNSVPERAFRRMNLIFFLAIDYDGSSPQRMIESVWESDGEREHRQVHNRASGDSPLSASQLITPDEHRDALATIQFLRNENARTIQDVRAALVA